MKEVASGHADAVEAARQRLLRNGPGADLYHGWFHQATGRQLDWPSAAAYRAAILHPDRFEPGWRVVAAAEGEAGACLVMRGGRQRVVAPPEYIPDDPRGLAPGRGTALRVYPLTSSEVGGFWHVWSIGWRDAAPDRILRVYVRVQLRHALGLARRIAAEAPARAVWSMKALCGAHDAGRRDSLLLYLPFGSDLHAGWTAGLIRAAARTCDGPLPPFVVPVASGIGWAPDPGDGRSFGQAVSAAMAGAAAHAEDPVRFADVALAGVRAIPGYDGSLAETPHR